MMPHSIFACVHENSVTLRTVAVGTCFGMRLPFSRSSTLPKNATSDLVTASFLVKRQAVGRQRFQNGSKCMSKPEIPSRGVTPVVLRYGLAVGSVCIALSGALLLGRYNFPDVADPLFLLAIAITVWYAGRGPAIFAFVLSSLANSYFFIEPIYSIAITRSDIPHFIIFILFALLITGFAAIRRRIEQELREARDKLEIE